MNRDVFFRVLTYPIRQKSQIFCVFLPHGHWASADHAQYLTQIVVVGLYQIDAIDQRVVAKPFRLSHVQSVFGERKQNVVAVVQLHDLDP